MLYFCLFVYVGLFVLCVFCWCNVYVIIYQVDVYWFF